MGRKRQLLKFSVSLYWFQFWTGILLPVLRRSCEENQLPEDLRREKNSTARVKQGTAFLLGQKYYVYIKSWDLKYRTALLLMCNLRPILTTSLPSFSIPSLKMGNVSPVSPFSLVPLPPPPPPPPLWSTSCISFGLMAWLASSKTLISSLACFRFPGVKKV